MDPSTDVPAGFTAAQRGQPNGFMGDPDIMDTWATSSLTPQIVSGWGVDPALFAQVFPMSLRPQAHDIIRTWLFSTVLRAELEHGSLPWAHTAISGWVLDPDRKKMSKSKGNVVTPAGLLDEHGSDAVRYWAASGGPGVDTAFDPAQMKVGRGSPSSCSTPRSSSSPATCRSSRTRAPVTAPLDRGMLTNLAALVADVTGALDDYDYAKALQRTEAFFWDFCDNYVELVKARRYGDATVGGARRPRARPRRRRRCAPRSRCCCGCSRRTCRSRPRKCGRGGGRARCTTRRGRRRPRCWPGSAARRTPRRSAATSAPRRCPPRCGGRRRRRRCRRRHA